MKALFIGRFQPFHIGHYKMVKYLLENYDKVIVVVGSSQECLTKQNPFSANERRTMIHLCFPNASKLEIISLTDVSNDDLWVTHLSSNVPEFDHIYSNNDLVIRLFKEKGIEVKGMFFDRHKLEGKKIRGLLKKGEGKDLLPPEVYDYLKQINGIKRLQNL